MNSAFIIDNEVLNYLKNLTINFKRYIINFFKIEFSKFNENTLSLTLKKLISLSNESKSLILTWLKYGTLIGFTCNQVFTTPLGSLIINLKRCKSTLINLTNFFSELTGKGLAYEINDFIYIPYLFKLCEYINYPGFENIQFFEVDEYLKIPYSVMILYLPYTYSIQEFQSVNEFLCTLIRDLGIYFESLVLDCFVNFSIQVVELSSFINLVIDVLTLTKDSIIAHKVVDTTKTYHLGFSTIESYLRQGFDKCILVHLLPRREIIDRTLRRLLTQKLLTCSGYIIINQPYDITYVEILKWCFRNEFLRYSKTALEKNFRLRKYLFGIYRLK